MRMRDIMRDADRSEKSCLKAIHNGWLWAERDLEGWFTTVERFASLSKGEGDEARKRPFLCDPTGEFGPWRLHNIQFLSERSTIDLPPPGGVLPLKPAAEYLGLSEDDVVNRVKAAQLQRYAEGFHAKDLDHFMSVHGGSVEYDLIAYDSIAGCHLKVGVLRDGATTLATNIDWETLGQVSIDRKSRRVRWPVANR